MLIVVVVFMVTMVRNYHFYIHKSTKHEMHFALRHLQYAVCVLAIVSNHKPHIELHYYDHPSRPR